MSTTRYYDLNADALVARYDGVDSADVHADWVPAHLREEPGFACDIGAGSGRDANWLAARGWEVVAVEPSVLRNLAAENDARGFHDTSAGELIGFANRRAIVLRSHSTPPDLTRPGIHWETLVFVIPDDGSCSLPLLRHVIVNDNKSSTYKLGLLRTLVRLAETAPGLVINRTDDYVEIPFGAVGLYWLKQYLPLVLHHRLPQRPSGPGGAGQRRRSTVCGPSRLPTFGSVHGLIPTGPSSSPAP